jgi:adenylate cyclase
MFVDLPDFTSFAETAPARELALVLAEYRQLVSGTIFQHGGTVDKFIGDGVMAVFGQPTPTEDDADRA